MASKESKHDGAFPIRVRLNQKKAVVVPVSAKLINESTLLHLASDLAARLRVDRIVAMRTPDGFSYDLNDQVRDVLRSGDTIDVLDYKGHIQENNQYCSNSWASVTRSDFVDNHDKWAAIGWSKDLQKLFIRMAGKGTYKNPDAVELFEVDDLRHFAKPGKKLIARIGEDKSWHCQAEFLINKDGVAEAVEFSVKAKSDERPEIVIVPITIDLELDPPVSAGEVKKVQDADLPAVEVKYAISSALVASGPTLVEKKQDAKSNPTKNELVPDNKSQGSLSLLMMQKSHIEVEQDWVRDGQLQHRVHCDFELLNRGDSGTIVIVKRTVEYKKGDEWIEVPHLIGYREGYYHWRTQEQTGSMTFEPKSPTPMAITALIKVPCTLQKDRHRRLHHSIPDPLTLRYTMIDMNNGSISMQVTYKNPSPDVRTLELTKADKAKDKGKVFAWLQCDDTECEDRAVVEGWYTETSRDGAQWTIQPNFGSTYFTLNELTLKKMAWQAAKENKTEFVTDLAAEHASPKWKLSVTALVDLKHKVTFGLKLSLNTSTSSASQSFLLRPDKFL